MIAFQVNDMTCGHCVSTITKALKAADPRAEVVIDLGRRLVTIEGATEDAPTLRGAIVDAGYDPMPVAAPAAQGPVMPGGCSGCG